MLGQVACTRLSAQDRAAPAGGLFHQIFPSARFRAWRGRTLNELGIERSEARGASLLKWQIQVLSGFKLVDCRSGKVATESTARILEDCWCAGFG
jgi:hypothetical protein